jgi:hypothetical protein
MSAATLAAAVPLPDDWTAQATRSQTEVAQNYCNLGAYVAAVKRAVH